MTRFKTALTTAALAAGLSAGLAACNNPESAPEPQNEEAAQMMPDTPDAGAAQNPAAAGATGQTTPADGAPTEPAATPAG